MRSTTPVQSPKSRVSRHQTYFASKHSPSLFTSIASNFAFTAASTSRPDAGTPRGGTACPNTTQLDKWDTFPGLPLTWMWESTMCRRASASEVLIESSSPISTWQPTLAYTQTPQLARAEHRDSPPFRVARPRAPRSEPVAWPRGLRAVSAAPIKSSARCSANPRCAPRASAGWSPGAHIRVT